MTYLIAAGMIVAPPAPVIAGQDQDHVATARARYNQGRYDDAIELAHEALQETGSAGAAIVVARSKLERFRAEGNQTDLEEARDQLRRIQPQTLSDPERAEWELGVAATLYLFDEFGAAAEILDRLLREDRVSGIERDRLVDWWASAVDHAGRSLDQPTRARTYTRLAERLELELARNPMSAAATYWVVEAVRGAGDLERAWSLSVAGWIRAGAGHAALHADLDRLVLQGVIPDLAVSRTSRPYDDAETIAVMAQLAGEWETIKARWTPP